MKQVLNPSEWAEEAAHKPPEEGADQQEKTHHIVRKLKIPAAQHGLQSADGTRPQGAGAGVVV